MGVQNVLSRKGKAMKSVDVMRCVLVKESVLKYGTKVNYYDEAEAIFEQMIGNSPEEIFAMICVDAKSNIVGYHEIAHGAITECSVDLRSVFKRAILNNAIAIIVAHNHPSGDSEPSAQDVDLTKRLAKAGEILLIDVADHIILGNTNFSFRAKMPEVLGY